MSDRLNPKYWKYKSGDALAICDLCGFRFYHSQLKKRWDGLMVCGPDFEERHPQDTIKGIKEKLFIDDARPEGSNTFLTATEVTADDL